jgi:hypothetical protein
MNMTSKRTEEYAKEMFVICIKHVVPNNKSFILALFDVKSIKGRCVLSVMIRRVMPCMDDGENVKNLYHLK